MNKMWLIIQEHFDYLSIIFRIAKYENKASYRGHYLGVAWEILNPLLQVSVFYLVFGLGLRGNEPINGVAFLPWLIIGQASWMFMNQCVNSGSNSIRSKLGLVSKMKFPMSVLPTIVIISKLKTFFVKILIGIITAFFMSGALPTFHWLQFVYYFMAMMVFLIFMGVLTSAVSILFNDFQNLLGTVMRLMFFTSGIMFPLDEMKGRLGAVFRLSPFHYVVDGFRNVLLFQTNFWERGLLPSLFFWSFTLIIGIIGTHLHLKFRAKFSDFV